jgi:Glycosyltransferases involved in cell wall biogenesis
MADVKVSVLIPVYNMELYIEEAIESVLNQTYNDYEIIIVDNHSTDNTWPILLKYEAHPKCILIKNERNLGMAQNWNRCLFYAKGKYLKVLNADDILEQTALQEYVNILANNPTISLVTSHYKTFGIDNNVMYSKYVGQMNGKEAIINTIETSNWIGCPTQVMFRREDLYVGYFNIASTWWADMDLWYRLLTIGDLFVIDKILSQNRSHPGQVSHQFADQKSLVSYNSFYKVMLQSDTYTFCKDVLNNKIKKISFILFYEGVLYIIKGKSHHGKYLLSESGNSIFSLNLIRVPFFFISKKMKK